MKYTSNYWDLVIVIQKGLLQRDRRKKLRKKWLTIMKAEHSKRRLYSTSSSLQVIAAALALAYINLETKKMHNRSKKTFSTKVIDLKRYKIYKMHVTYKKYTRKTK